MPSPHYNRSHTGHSQAQKPFVQCFWHANGQLACENTVVPMTTPESYVVFNSFGQPNSKYQPDKYRENQSYYQKPTPCCNVPCKQACSQPTPTYISPPIDPSSRFFK